MRAQIWNSVPIVVVGHRNCRHFFVFWTSHFVVLVLSILLWRVYLIIDFRYERRYTLYALLNEMEWCAFRSNTEKRRSEIILSRLDFAAETKSIDMRFCLFRIFYTRKNALQLDAWTIQYGPYYMEIFRLTLNLQNFVKIWRARSLAVNDVKIYLFWWQTTFTGSQKDYFSFCFFFRSSFSSSQFAQGGNMYDWWSVYLIIWWAVWSESLK